MPPRLQGQYACPHNSRMRWLSDPLERFVARLTAGAHGVLVSVERTEGSVPREVGAWMGVTSDAVDGTVGGGHLEHVAIARARDALALRAADRLIAPAVERFALGPRLGQCCGGVVWLRFEPVSATDRAALGARLASRGLPVALFGAGHVGRAIAHLLAVLPARLHWIDSREGAFADIEVSRAFAERVSPIHDAVPDLLAGSHVLIMSFSHAEDLDVLAACLARQRAHGDLPFIGLIGSRSKWARFAARLRQRGFTEAELAQVTCPIGLAGMPGKEPGVVALSAVAQLMALRAHGQVSGVSVHNGATSECP